MRVLSLASSVAVLALATLAAATPVKKLSKSLTFVNSGDLDAVQSFDFLPTGPAKKTLHSSKASSHSAKAVGKGKSSHGVLSQQTKTTVSATGKHTAWNVLTHASFPKYSVRVRENVQLCDPDVKQYVGYLDTDDDKHFFFWFFESRSSPSTDPVVLWLNGGPGCSSLTGLLMELGPCRVNPGGNGTTINKSSWNDKANVIFLDQPINVGFSYGEGKITDSDAAAADVYAFLQILFQKYSQFASLPFYVTGESYAGHYIPAIGKVISDSNAGVRSPKSRVKSIFVDDGDNDGGDDGIVEIQLKGLAIGNGLTDPLVQYEFYPDMACDDKYGPILDEAECDAMRSKYSTCKSLISACYNWKSAFTCVPGSLYCNSAMIQPFQKSGKNIYDIRKDCDASNPLCYSILNDIEAWLNDADIQEILGVDVSYQGCNRDINLNFLMAGDWMRPYVSYIPPLLEEGVNIMIYAGDADYICNWIGNKAWTVALEWEGQEGFNEAEDKAWVSKTTGQPAGEFRMYENFSFVRVFEAGHMVPYDQPEHSLEMINHFIQFTKSKPTPAKLIKPHKPGKKSAAKKPAKKH
ncbi:Alpha/Beta hydrolase protein [Entophlyctis helioformis]|nr:Alpha/Beta hydrolase protein [Entophlyctis helioformis]